nr:retrovirus-related Pol polyprotein from transposon TNT 1-94 [Tanacetum cinerariifolium]
MTGNRSYVTNYEEINEVFVAFGGNSKGGKITRKGKIRTSKLDFKDVYFVKELKFNLFSLSQMCDKKNNILFTDTACVVLSPDFKLTDESHVLLKVPRKNNMYSVDLKNVVPQEGIENIIDLRVKVIRCDNGTEFKNRVMNQFCEMKGRKPALSFLRPFGCPIPILNIINHQGKFDGKADEGFFIGYSTNSKAFKVFNSRTRIVKENMQVKFIENTPNIIGSRPNWLFDIDALTKSMNYKPIVIENQSNGSAGTKVGDNVGFSWCSLQTIRGGEDVEDLRNEDSEFPSIEEPRVNQERDENVNNTNTINIVSSTVNAASNEVNAVGTHTQEEGISYDEVFALVARIEAIRLFLAYASFKDFVVYQVDVNSAFLYGKNKEEVYVCQPPGFEDPDFPDRVYKVEKTL